MSDLRAQAFGQWWWNGRLGWAASREEARRDGDVTSRADQETLTASLNLHGYILHPRIGQFRLGVAHGSSSFGEQASLGFESLGYSGELRILPLGPAPLSLSYSRNSLDSKAEPGEANRGRLVNSSESWGAHLRVRRGPLSGLILGASFSENSFIDDSLGSDRRDRQLMRWGYRTERTNGNLRADRFGNEFGGSGFKTAATRSTFDQGFRLSERFSWTLGLSALRFDTDRFSEQLDRKDDFRLRSTMRGKVRQEDRFNFSLNARRLDLGAGDPSTAAAAALSYSWKVGRNLHISSSISHSRSFGDGSEIQTSGGSLGVSWSHRGRVDLTLSSGVGYSVAGDGSQAGISGGLSLGAGDARRLRFLLEVSGVTNEFRLETPGSDLPPSDTPLIVDRIGTSTSAQVRLNLLRERRARTDTWIQYLILRTDPVDGEEIESTTWSGQTRVSWRRLTLAAGYGGASAPSPVTDSDQHVDYLTATASLRIVRSLYLDAFARSDRRTVDPLPTIESRHIETGLRFAMGLLQISLRGYENRNQPGIDREIVDRGLRLIIERELLGWLPIVSAPKRRGEIL